MSSGIWGEREGGFEGERDRWRDGGKETEGGERGKGRDESISQARQDKKELYTWMETLS